MQAKVTGIEPCIVPQALRTCTTQSYRYSMTRMAPVHAPPPLSADFGCFTQQTFNKTRFSRCQSACSEAHLKSLAPFVRIALFTQVHACCCCWLRDSNNKLGRCLLDPQPVEF